MAESRPSVEPTVRRLLYLGLLTVALSRCDDKSPNYSVPTPTSIPALTEPIPTGVPTVETVPTPDSLPDPLPKNSASPNPEVTTTQGYPYYRGPRYTYMSDKTAISTIEEAEKLYNIRLTVPHEWQTSKGNAFINLTWSGEEMRALEDTFSKLPLAYLYDKDKALHQNGVKEILLYKVPEEHRFHITHQGGYFNDKFYVVLYQDWDPVHIPSHRQRIEFIAAHEWTHWFTESHPAVIHDWARHTDWYQEAGTGRWKNTKSADLGAYALSSDSIKEDIADSVALMMLQPSQLSPSRVAFFRENPYFSDWAAVANYRPSPTPESK